MNEIDPFAAKWIGRLWPDATIETRSIRELNATDVATFQRAHFFAGIGGWQRALQLADWPASRPVWTGSCPCQPFSAAGSQKGESDERHLWPEFRRLIAECRPPTIFGEQVASKLGREWLTRVRADLEALGYAVGAADLCAAGAGAPHIRQRLFWVANRPRGLADGDAHGCCRERSSRLPADSHSPQRNDADRRCETGRMGYPNGAREGSVERIPAGPGTERAGGTCGMGDAENERCGQERALSGWRTPRSRAEGRLQRPWDDFDVIPCRDGKARRIEPGTFPLAHGVSHRVGRLRGYGNAIVPQVAAAFIRAFLMILPASAQKESTHD